MRLKFDILRSDWTPGDRLHLVDCTRRGSVLQVGTAYIKRRINADRVVVYSEDREYAFCLLLPEDLQKNQNNTVQLQTTFEIEEDQ